MAANECHRFARLIVRIADYLADVWHSNVGRYIEALADRFRFIAVQVVFVGGTTGEGGQCQCSP